MADMLIVVAVWAEPRDATMVCIGSWWTGVGKKV